MGIRINSLTRIAHAPTPGLRQGRSLALCRNHSLRSDASGCTTFSLCVPRDGRRDRLRPEEFGARVRRRRLHPTGARPALIKLDSPGMSPRSYHSPSVGGLRCTDPTAGSRPDGGGPVICIRSSPEPAHPARLHGSCARTRGRALGIRRWECDNPRHPSPIRRRLPHANPAARRGIGKVHWSVDLRGIPPTPAPRLGCAPGCRPVAVRGGPRGKGIDLRDPCASAGTLGSRGRRASSCRRSRGKSPLDVVQGPLGKAACAAAS